MTMRRFVRIVGEGPSASASLEEVARRRRFDGDTTIAGWNLPELPWFVDGAIVYSTVSSPHDATAALTALLRDGELLLAFDDEWPDRDRRRFEADLDDFATVEHLDSAEPESLPLTDEQRTILSMLAVGMSIPAAATELYLSVRTCERRVGQARRALGVRSTAEAIAVVVAHEADGGRGRAGLNRGGI